MGQALTRCILHITAVVIWCVHGVCVQIVRLTATQLAAAIRAAGVRQTRAAGTPSPVVVTSEEAVLTYCHRSL